MLFPNFVFKTAARTIAVLNGKEENQLDATITVY
jgi:hypothetical protein